jgi:hypothetical protein
MAQNTSSASLPALLIYHFLANSGSTGSPSANLSSKSALVSGVLE